VYFLSKSTIRFCYWKFIFLLSLSYFLLNSCQKETQVERANRDKILLVGNGGEPKSLDPQLVTGVIENKILLSLFEGLVADDVESDDATPQGAATSWEHNGDFTEWIFHLREDAKWSDGELVTAHDFTFSYERILHPNLIAPYAEMLYFIKNAEEFNKGKIASFSEVGVKAVDDLTLKISLKEPVPYLLEITRHFTWFPLPRHTVLKYGKISDKFTPWAEVGNMVGNGAFRLKKWKLHDCIEVEKNQYYWNAQNVLLNGIKYFPIENPYTETRAYLAKQLHTTYQLPPDLVDKAKQDFPKDLRQEPYLGSRFVRVNITRAGLSDSRVRLALSYAIDRKELCENILEGFTPATSLSPNMGAYQPEPAIHFDLQKAQQLLADAGFPNGKNFPRYSMLMGSGATRATSEALQAMWKKNLNIVIDLKALDWGSYVFAQQSLNYDLAIAGWSGDYLDPTTFLLMWTKGNGNNNTGWSSEVYENLLDQAAQSSDIVSRFRFFVKAEKLLMDEQPLIPFAWQSKNYLHDPSIKGWHPLLLDNHPWSKVSLRN
jgi:oligopeptide transport system substrate-binding protein